MRAHEPLELGREAGESDDAVHVANTTRDVAVVRTAELDRSIDDRLKDSVEVEGRARDRLDHIADRRLALRGALQLAPEHRQLAGKRSRIIHRR